MSFDIILIVFQKQHFPSKIILYHKLEKKIFPQYISIQCKYDTIITFILFHQFCMIGTLSSTLLSTQTRTYTQNLNLQVIAVEQKTVQALRTAFNHWIRSLPMEERFLAVKIQVSKLSKTIRHILPRFQARVNEYPQPQLSKRVLTKKSQKWNDSKKVINKIEKGFWQSLVLVSDGNDYLDNFCFDFGLLECPQKLYDLLMATVENNNSHPIQEALKSRRSEEVVVKILENCMSREQLAVEVVAFLRQQVLLRFRQSVADSQFIAHELEEEKNRKKQFSAYWKYLNEEYKLKLLLLGNFILESGTNSSKALRDWLSEQDIQMGVEELQKQIQDLLKLQKNQFCNRIFKCKLKKSMQPVIAYYELVYNQWKGEVEKIRKKRLIKHMKAERDLSSQQNEEDLQEKKMLGRRGKHHHHRKSTSVESNQTNETENEKILQKVQLYNHRQEIQKQQLDEQLRRQKYKNSYSLLERQQELQPSKIQRKMEYNSNKKRSKIRQQDKSNHDYFDNNQKGRADKIKVENNPQNREKPQIIHGKLQKNSSSSINLSSKKMQVHLPLPKSTISKSHITEANYLRLEDQLQQMSDRISEEANEFHERRVIGFQRIQFLLQWYNIPIRLFGSCASGIAVKNSDIDIAIDNSLLSYMQFLPEAERIKAALQWLEEIFKTHPCFTQIKLIKTAVIPVIKLTIDTSFPFLDPSIGQMYYILNRNHCSGPLDADITIQTRTTSDECNHVGIISTNTINSWLSQIPTLHTIVIVMKQYFLKKKLNVTYGGGLNGFSMIVLFVAYIYHSKLKEEHNAAVVLQKIIRFYTEEFDERKTGINLLNGDNRGIFYDKGNIEIDNSAVKNNQMQRADLQMQDPMQQGKNMTRNCYLFPQIKRLFRLMIDECFQKSWRDFSFLANEGTAKCGGELYESSKERLQNKNVFVELLGSMHDPI